MASQPRILNEWPWAPLGSFKYIILAPWVVHGAYQFMAKGPGERDLSYFIVFPFLLSRVLHNQIWISLSRHRTAKGKNRIVDRGIEFQQVNRESNWDDQIILSGILLYIGLTTIPAAANLPFWRGCVSHNLAPHWSSGVPLLLASQGIASPLPLLSLSLTSPLLYCH
ncbi:hypothetical protein SAY86_014337 [Trapa natans]|uniref:Uncharacterized protein n=1 Tax=Trapa natans TaxID=22666 RepID=A0AAN7QMW1_TRANT|nr:hypothetical protein SAY86_014337 [Trapa natans]